MSVKRRSSICTLCSLTNAITAFGSGLVSAILLLLIAARAVSVARPRFELRFELCGHQAHVSTSFSRGAAQSSGVGILTCELHCRGKIRGRGRLPTGHSQEYVPQQEVANTMFLWPR